MQDTRVGKLTGICKKCFKKSKLARSTLASSDAGVRALAKGRTRIGGHVLQVQYIYLIKLNDPTARVAITGGLPARVCKKRKLIN